MAEASLKKGLTNPLPVDLTSDYTRLLGQLCVANSPIDPRAIRALTYLTDSVDISNDISFTEGGQKRLVVTDDETRNLLTQILKELKKNNIYLAKMSDEYIRNADIIDD